MCVPGMPSPTELKTVGDDSCSTLEEEEDTMRLYVCVWFTTKHFTMTQLKLFTLVGVANLLLEVGPELLYGAGPNWGVW
jgi:hypothetical protein